MTRTLAAGLLAITAAAVAQTAGPRLATFRSSADGTEQPYALYVPPAFDAARRWPLVVSLHAEETDHRINLRQILGAPSRTGEMAPADMRYGPAHETPYFIVSPLARGTIGYEGIAERDVYDAIADVERHYPIDEDRVYLTGISMGGGGALGLALTRPDVWAAVAPLCPVEEPGSDEVIGNALNLPVRIYHGEQDPIVPAAASRALQRKLVDAGVPAEYIEYPGVRHNVWDFAYRNGAVFEWFGQFRRKRNPERVRLTTSSYRYGSAYWVRIDGLTPGTPATLDARRTNIATRNLDAFTLTLERPVAMVTIDGAPLRSKPAAMLSFERIAGKWRSVPTTASRPHLEGPIAAAFAGRTIFVYGSAGTRTPGELADRRRVAEHARFLPAQEVRMDSELNPQDAASANLILFGTSETNLAVARLAAQLPMSLNPGAADYGLVFIAVAGDRYVVVNSGLPWWTGAEDAGRGGDRFQPLPLRVASTFGDYLLFRGSLRQVVAEGRYDAAWRVPAAAIAKMSASGTVTFRESPR